MEKVVFVIHRFHTGGVERMFINIANQTTSQEVYLIALNNDYDDVYSEIPKHVSVIDFNDVSSIKMLRGLKFKFGPLKSFVDILILITQIFYLCRKINIDFDLAINFSDTISTLLFTSFFKCSKFSWIHLNPRVIKASSLSKLYEILYKRFNYIICICNDQKTLFLNQFNKIDPLKVKVVYNTIDLALINKKLAEPLDIKYDKYLLMVSRLDNRSKDFITVIKAYYQLFVDSPAIPPLYILGDGPDKNFIQGHISNLGLEEKIILMGNEINPYKWMKRSMVFIFSSRSEGFGLVLLEAMYCGARIISTDCEVGPREILENGRYGALVKVGDITAMKNEIYKIIHDSSANIEINKESIERANAFSAQVRSLAKEIY